MNYKISGWTAFTALGAMGLVGYLAHIQSPLVTTIGAVIGTAVVALTPALVKKIAGASTPPAQDPPKE